MSYGTNAPQGFQPRQYLNGSTWSGEGGEYLINSGYETNLFTGDPITLLNNGSIGIGVAGSAWVGVFNGVKYQDSLGVQQFKPYWPASTVTFGTVAATAFVIDDSNVLFDVQATTSNAGTHTAAIVQTDLNLNCNGVAAAGSTTTGQSAWSIDLATLNTTDTLNTKLIRLTPVPGNDFGTLYNNALVLINNHIYKGGTGTAGV
jgi:hypothetical protein